VNLNFLETFVWVARLKSFTLAAQRLNATQAAVSARIAALEKELDVRLFVREHRNLRLTPEGLDALARADSLLAAARAFVDEVGGRQTLRGTVRIGVIDTITYTWLSDLIRLSKSHFPQVAIEVTADTSLRLMELLRAGEVDVALVMGPMLDPGCINLELCTYACHWVAAPSLPLGHGRSTLAELAAYPVISFPKGSQPNSAIRHFFDQYPELDVVMHSANSLATIIRMTMDGVGVATIPPVVAPRELERGELVLVEAEQPIPPMRLHATYFDSPKKLIPATIAELAREAAGEFCRRTDPAWAWNRPRQTAVQP
jgi:DNA-binding transcriptional LysR family regulator